MLTLTENATTIVSDIIREIPTRPGQPDSAGLRITSQAGAPAEPAATFEVSAAEAAEPGDQVVEQRGATVYLDQRAAVLLDDKILDAAVDAGGQVEFALGMQA